MQSKPKEREELMLRIIDLARAVRDRGVDPFEIEVRELFDRLRAILPKISDPEELFLDIQAVLGLSDVIFQQGEWIKHRSSLLYFDPLLVHWKLKSLSTEELARIFVNSWHPIVGLECITPPGIKQALDYWNNLPSLEERRVGIDATEVLTGEIARRELTRLGLMSRKDFATALEKFWGDLKKAAGKKGQIDYWKFVGADTFEETISRAWLTSFLVSYGYATLELKPLEEEIILKPAKQQKIVAKTVPSSVPIPISLAEWKRRAKNA
jgi:hypothetical protein